MTLSKKDIDHIAHLARLHLSEEEKERYRGQLSDILEHVSALNVLDTADVTPMNSVAVEGSRLREDVPGEPMSRADLLRNAPDVESKQFRVPPVLE